MEIRDPIHGPIAVSAAEMQVILHPLFTRLRGIRQLDFSEYTFPGACHSRYLHSLGTMHLAGLAFDMVARDLAPSIPDADLRRLRQTVRLAGLLHDLGHPPMSHTGEQLLPDLACITGAPNDEGAHIDHETMTRILLRRTDINDLITTAFKDDGIQAEHVEALLSPASSVVHNAPFTFGSLDTLSLFRQMISGELDVDRMDYLLRDSYFTGVTYGRFEKDWLLSHMGATVEDGRAVLTLETNAVFTFEDFLLSRHHMFLMVYSHPRTQVYHRLLRRFIDATGLRMSADLDRFTEYDDAWLTGELRRSENPDARRICSHDIPRLMYEAWGDEADRLAAMQDRIQAALPESTIVLDSMLAFSKYFSRGRACSTAPTLRIRQVTPGGFTRIVPVEQYSDMYVRQARPRRSLRIFGDTDCIPEVEEVISRIARNA